MEKPIIVERFADNGDFSHYALIEKETGNLLWSEAPKEEMQQVKNDVLLHNVSNNEVAVCPYCKSPEIYEKDDHYNSCTNC